jgi:hypothetical protein
LIFGLVVDGELDVVDEGPSETSVCGMVANADL